MTAVRLVYPLIRSVAELEALPDGTIVMMDPETTTTPVPWGACWRLLGDPGSAGLPGAAG